MTFKEGRGFKGDTKNSLEKASNRIIKIIKKKDISEPIKKIEIVEPEQSDKEVQTAKEWGDDLRGLVKLKQGKIGSLTPEEMAARDEKAKQEARRILGGE